MADSTLRGPRLGRTVTLTAGLLTLLAHAAAGHAADPPKAGDKGSEMIQVINEAIKKGWEDNKLTPSGLCSDYTFIRRASLDIIGRVATPEEVKAFMAQAQATRRAWLVEKLLKSEEYPRHWANTWANWLLTRSGPFGGRSSYHEDTQVWLEDQFAQNVPLNQLVTKLVTAKGKNTENPEVNFILASVGEANPQNVRGEQGQFDMVPVTSRLTRLFLGIRTNCAQCHDHPFDARVRQQDFWGVNAFLRQVERKGTPPMMMNNRPPVGRGPMLELVVNTDNNPDGYVSYEKRNGVILKTKPNFMGAGKPDDIKVDRRDELAKFLIDHPMFGQAYVNRMWGHFFGRGFANPIDDFNEQNQPSHPELLQTLGEKFKHYGYDMKNVIRWITLSQPYQLSSVANKTNVVPDAEPFFARMRLKVLSPEELFESIATAAGNDLNKDAKKELRDRWMNNLVANFGDDEGNEVNYNGTVVQALLMMNGVDLNNAVSDANGLVGKAMKARKGEPKGIIYDIYMATLNRPPTDKEMSGILSAMALVKPIRVGNKEVFQPIPEAAASPAKFQDLLWAVLNSNEFMLNH